MNLNLEIITDADKNLLSYRYDIPQEMIGMGYGEGLWTIYKEADVVEGIQSAVRDMSVRLRGGGSIN